MFSATRCAVSALISFTPGVFISIELIFLVLTAAQPVKSLYDAVFVTSFTVLYI